MRLVPSLLSLYLALTPRSVVRGDGNTIYSFSFLCCQLSQDQAVTGPELSLFAWYMEIFVCFCYPLSISSWTTVSIAQKVLLLFLAVFTPHVHLGLGANGVGTRDKMSFISKHNLLHQSMFCLSRSCPFWDFCFGFWELFMDLYTSWPSTYHKHIIPAQRTLQKYIYRNC